MRFAFGLFTGILLSHVTWIQFIEGLKYLMEVVNGR